MDIHADVLIIGSGVAGALLACELAGKGARVVIMEAGRRVDRAEAVSRFHAAYPKTPESAYFTPHPAVDKDLRAHDHGNLFLIGAAVFPTGGTANPTLTVAALALRATRPVLAAIAESSSPL